MYFDGIKRRFLRTGFHGLRIHSHIYIYTCGGTHTTPVVPGGICCLLLLKLSLRLPPPRYPNHRTHQECTTRCKQRMVAATVDGIQGKGEQE